MIRASITQTKCLGVSTCGLCMQVIGFDLYQHLVEQGQLMSERAWAEHGAGITDAAVLCPAGAIVVEAA